MTNKKMLSDAREVLSNINCLERVELKLKKNRCYNIEIYRGYDNVIFRCQKPNMKRKNFWDTWWFRLTSSSNKFEPKKLPIIEKHTVCFDSQYRIEAYPPEEKG